MSAHPADRDEARRRELMHVVDSAQRAAGMLAARHRGDIGDAMELMQSFDDERELANGALLLAELTLGLYSRATGRDVETCVREVNLQMEAAFEGGPPSRP